MKHAAIIGLLAIAGCCPGIDAETPIHFDSTFTEMERAVLVSAVTEWAVALDRDMPPMDYEEPHGFKASTWLDDRSVVHRMTEAEAFILRDIGEEFDVPWGPRFAGLASPGGSIILAIERLSDPAKLRHVMLHELGHRYGCMGHEPGTLMAGSIGKDLDCIDAETLEQVCDQQPDGCGPDARATCE